MDFSWPTIIQLFSWSSPWMTQSLGYIVNSEVQEQNIDSE